MIIIGSIYLIGFLILLGFCLSIYEPKQAQEKAGKILLASAFWPVFVIVLLGAVIGHKLNS